MVGRYSEIMENQEQKPQEVKKIAPEAWHVLVPACLQGLAVAQLPPAPTAQPIWIQWMVRFFMTSSQRVF